MTSTKNDTTISNPLRDLELLNEIKNQFRLEDDINYLFLKWTKAVKHSYSTEDLERLVYGLDEESIQYVKSWFIKMILVHTDRYKELVKTIPNQILNLIVPVKDRDIINKPQLYMYNSKFLEIEKKYGLAKIYSLVAKSGGIDYFPDEAIEYIKTGTIFDIGSYNAQNAIVYTRYTDKTIYAVEPIQKHVELMKENIASNHMSDQIEIVPCGLGDHDDTYTIDNSEPERRGRSFTTSDIHYSGDNSYTLDITTVDNFVQKNNIKKVSFLRIVAEGYEQPILKGMTETLKKDKPVLLIGDLNYSNNLMKMKPLLEDMNLGYKFKILDTDPLFYDIDVAEWSSQHLHFTDYMLMAY